MGENVLGGGMSPADVRAVMGNNNDWGGGSAWWVIILFALIYGGNGFGFGRGGYQPQYATQDFVQNGFNFNDLQDQNRDLMQAITGGTAQSVAATNQVFHDMYAVLNDKYGELQRDIATLAVGQANALANQNQCCCNIQRAIDGVNYTNALNTANITQVVQAEGNMTRAMLQQDKYERLQMQYQDLNQRLNTQELMGAINTATAGVVRYPDTFAYNAGNNPFCGCNNNYMGCPNI